MEKKKRRIISSFAERGTQYTHYGNGGRAGSSNEEKNMGGMDLPFKGGWTDCQKRGRRNEGSFRRGYMGS